MSALLQTINFNHLTNWSVAHLLESQFNYNQAYELVKIGDFLTRNRNRITIDDNTEYKRVTIRMNNNGIALRDRVMGRDIGTKKQFLIEKGQFLLSKIDARNGAFGLATDEVDGAIITADFFAYEIDKTKIEPYFLVLMTTTKQFQRFAQGASSGTTGRQRIDEKKFLDVKIPLPSLEKQKEIVDAYQSKISLAEKQEQEAKEKEKEIEAYLYRELGIEVAQSNSKSEIFKIIDFSKLNISWSLSDLLSSNDLKAKYKLISLNEVAIIIMGSSPKSNELNTRCKGYQFIGGASDIKNKNIISKRYIESSSKISIKGDILYLVRATIGKPFIINDSYYLGRGVASIRVNENIILRDYLIDILELFEDRIISLGKGSTFKQISKPDLVNLEIPLPPLETQKKIVIYIEILKNEILKLKEKSEQNRVLALQEFEKEIFNEA